MTLALFHDETRLPQCAATVTAADASGVQLDRTVFYPLGGGQAGDRGQLLLPDGRALRIADTRKAREGGGILHVPEPGQDDLLAGLQAGLPVTAQIDWQRRHRHMRLHTSTHLLCALVPQPVDGCSITADYARLDFHMDEPLDKDELSAGLARLVALARPVVSRWITEAELDANPGLVRSMSVQPPRGLGRVRVIDIEGIDLQPCGGTHVENTAEIGVVRVTKVEKKSAMTRRVVLGFGDT
jgi:misacylated tRNA(Ala) deacylase